MAVMQWISAAVLATAVGVATGAENQAGFAGYLVAITPIGSQVDIHRGGAIIYAKRGMVLLEGDRISITGRARIHITSNLYNGDFDADASPIIFPPHEPPPPGYILLLQRLLSAAKVPFGALQIPPAKPAQTPTKGVGDCPPSDEHVASFEPLPQLRSTTQVLAANAPITLAWSGGTPPYVPAFKTDGDWRELRDSRSCETHLTLQHPAGSVAQPVELRIKDAAGKQISWTLSFQAATGASDTGSDFDKLSGALAELKQPTGDHGVDGLSKLKALEARNFIAWRVLRAIYERDRPDD